MDTEEPRFLHLAWHLELRNEVVPDRDAWWVLSSLGRAQRLAVVGAAQLLAERYVDGAVPYGFALAGVAVWDDGTLDLAGGSGLTCASFLAVLHAAAQAPLVDLPTWEQRTEQRRDQDKEVQQRLVTYLAKQHPVQAQRVRAEVGCTRLRSEEVASASGLRDRPAEFATCEAAGRALLRAAPELGAE